MIRTLYLFPAILLLTACISESNPTPTTPLPRILSVEAASNDVLLYEMIEFFITLDAKYENQFDSREVSLEAIFTGPDGSEWYVPGFWDADKSWVIRFTPSLVGIWDVELSVEDTNGISRQSQSQFAVEPSHHHGWLQVGSWVDPAYNSRYLAYHDGTPFYGIGHCNAFNLLSFGFDPDQGFSLFNKMVNAGENTLVYWPLYSNPFFSNSYDRYSLPDLKVIDLIVADAERKGIFLVFTIWNHDLLRDENHPWSKNNMGQWDSLNGFSNLVSIDDFFSDDEAWAWQENLYRYIIARWGYSKAIGMWQTVSEIEGTNVQNEQDRWHKKINRYFVENDPYRHPTTASMAGDQWWPEGFLVMDVIQMHSYNTENDPVETGPLLAEWTQKMSAQTAKPNFIGEFGTPNQRNQPEHLHNAIWAGLVSGAALTPMDWNDGGTWGMMTPVMLGHITNFAEFVNDLNLVGSDSSILGVTTSAEELRGWGIGDRDWAILWVQDISQTGKEIAEVRELMKPHSKEILVIDGLLEGDYEIQPYNTWEGVYLPVYSVTSAAGNLSIPLPDFERDLALSVKIK